MELAEISNEDITTFSIVMWNLKIAYRKWILRVEYITFSTITNNEENMLYLHRQV